MNDTTLFSGKKNRLPFLIFLLVCLFKSYSQEKTPKITVTVENQLITALFSEIEQLTDFVFYYDSNWFKEKTITKSYVNTEINTVLKDVFKDTEINFFIDDKNNIYLTKNSFIYDSLPKGFFGDEEDLPVVVETEEAPLEVAPVFNYINQEDNRQGKTISIGKATADRSQRTVRLTGRVIDFIDGKSVPDLAVIVDDGKQGTSTDANGRYSLAINKGKHTVKVSGLGYKDQVKNVIVYSNGALDFSIEESIEALDEVIVSESARRNVEIPVTGLISLEIEQIKTIPLVLGERDILKTALTLPGISNAGEGASGFNVRGGKTDQNLVLLDDGVIYNPSHFFGIFSALNPFSTGSADIYKGSIPVEFGGRLSSVFDLKTKTPNTEKFSGEAAIGPVTSTVVLEIPTKKEKAGLLVGGRGTYSGWILRSLDDDQLSQI